MSENGPSTREGDAADVEPSFRDLPQGTKFKQMVREVGPGWVALGLIPLPLGGICLGIGVSGGVHWLEVVGVALLVVGLLEHSIVWPIRRARLTTRRRSPK